MSRSSLYIIFTLFFIRQAYCVGAESLPSAVTIQGDEKSLDISDIPLPSHESTDFSLFEKNFDPQSELMDVIDKPETLIGLDRKTTALDFDEFTKER